MKIILLLTSSFIISSAYAQEYVPIIEKPIYITSSNIKCELDADNDKNSTRDWCDAGASIDVRVNVAQMRSVQSATSSGFTPDAKIVRFTVDANQPGTGIHLVKELQQDHSWFQSWANRRTYIGPFVSSYDLWVKPISGYTPKKVRDFPQNENRNYQHHDTYGFSIGINGQIGTEISGDGPKGSSDVGSSFAYNYSKTLNFDTKDYRINNNSSLSDFYISFEREFEECDEIYRRELGCYFTAPHWGSGWVFDKKKFNPISFSNFKPNYDVLYEAPISQAGITDFEMGVQLNYTVRFGTVEPTPLFSIYMPKDSSTNSVTVKQRIRIDWNHPIFEAEAHVTLQSLNHNDLCLDVLDSNDKVGSSVNSWSCHNNWNQIWGLDAQERYRSRVAPDRCLTVNQDRTLTIEQCSANLSQKWYWEGDKLFSRYIDSNNTRYLLNIVENNNIQATPENEATQARWKPILQNVKL
ncbi:TPA: leukocidin family pore-forming toxin [Photobacterium damselae]|uniref:leukocidin family pore-forming toxin n=1 Tax=Photobacterium damselae TaxID=38293 RepID=UPI001EEE8E12|nr:leukocidin family pore-forming toxin [Photobacterium damselae]UKA08485.1 leukocidin family pore-forming toxin [Photobacterium damselae subsp. damselae]UKA23125.1 leukocidin family pore-forming toxin [Photobacterium damselae subsp. damselae]